MTNEDDDLPGDTAEKVKTATEPEKKPVAVSPPPPPTPAPEPIKPKHTSRAIGIAKALGFSEDDINSLEPAALWEEINRVQELMSKRQRPAEPKKDEPKAEPPDEDEEFLKELEANTEVEPRYTKLLKKLVAGNKELRTKLTEREKRDVERAEQSINDALDGAFEKLAAISPKHAELIGSGSASEIDPGQFGWRASIYREAGIAMNGNTIDLSKETAASVAKKVFNHGREKLSKKVGGTVATSPPPPVEPDPAPAKKPTPPQDPVTGRFTAEQFAKSKLPDSDRSVDKTKLTGAAVVHQYLAENGDIRAERPYVEDDDSDLPG